MKWEMMSQELVLGQIVVFFLYFEMFIRCVICKWDQTVQVIQWKGSGKTWAKVCLKIVQTDCKNLLRCNYFHLSDVLKSADST